MTTGDAWVTTDQYGNTIRLTTSMVERRARMGKHTGDDHMSVEETQTVIETPHFIQQSTTEEDRRSYYRYEREKGKPPYKRATVAMTSTNEGLVISWGRQREPAKHEIPIFIDFNNRR